MNEGRVFPAKYDRRHDISIVATYKFTDKIDASLSWVFSSGNTATLAMQEFDAYEGETNDYYYYSLTPYVSSRNNYRLPNYHRMDASVNFHRNLKRGKRTINISVYNLYNRQNPYLVYQGYEDTWINNYYSQYKCLKQLSIFPIIPSVSYTWTF